MCMPNNVNMFQIYRNRNFETTAKHIIQAQGKAKGAIALISFLIHLVHSVRLNKACRNHMNTVQCKSNHWTKETVLLSFSKVSQSPFFNNQLRPCTSETIMHHKPLIRTLLVCIYLLVELPAIVRAWWLPDPRGTPRGPILENSPIEREWSQKWNRLVCSQSPRSVSFLP